MRVFPPQATKITAADLIWFFAPSLLARLSGEGLIFLWDVDKSIASEKNNETSGGDDCPKRGKTTQQHNQRCGASPFILTP